MPGKTMMYKFLNTFIDDLFAFTIKMPALHRLATLRDDIIFFVYLYQAWAYKVCCSNITQMAYFAVARAVDCADIGVLQQIDYSRVNEFGQGGDEEEVEEKKANQPLAAPADGDAKVKEGEELQEKANGAVSSGKEQGSTRKRKV